MEVDINRVFSIESSNNPLAHDKTDDARGLGQITPGALADWNRLNPGSRHNGNDLFDPDVNAKISDWYINTFIPLVFKNKGIEDSVENRIIAYNAGVGRAVEIINGNKPLPSITEDYLIKYQMGGDVKAGQQRLKDLGFNPGPIDGRFGPKTKKAFMAFQESDVESPVASREFGLQSLKNTQGAAPQLTP